MEISFSKHNKKNDLTFKCPVCGHINEFNSIDKHAGKQLEIIYCDSESGGCDQQIVLESVVETSIKLRGLKIEGIEYK